jgi:hypothetical protein
MNKAQRVSLTRIGSFVVFVFVSRLENFDSLNTLIFLDFFESDQDQDQKKERQNKI